MTIWKGVAVSAAALVLALALQGSAAGAGTAPSVYTVNSTTIPGVTTALVLKNGQNATVTATDAVCPWGTSLCYGPNGDSSAPAGFLLPGVPKWGLVGRVGSGPWVQVGSGPTKLSGSGVLVFAMNDDYYPDNTGSFRVTVTVGNACYPGHGYRDTNHVHCGPPGQTPGACYPGNGSSDTNRDHCGPPGQGTGNSNSEQPETATRGRAETATRGRAEGTATRGRAEGTGDNPRSASRALGFETEERLPPPAGAPGTSGPRTRVEAGCVGVSRTGTPGRRTRLRRRRACVRLATRWLRELTTRRTR